jgi:acyl carrier protein
MDSIVAHLLVAGRADRFSGPAANDAPRARAAEIDGAVRQAMTRHRRLHDGPFTMTRSLSELGVDLLALVGVVRELEEGFDVELPADEVLSWSTAAEMAASVQVALRGARRPRR